MQSYLFVVTALKRWFLASKQPSYLRYRYVGQLISELIANKELLENGYSGKRA